METSVNNKCKAFTSLEQSKKLAEILPIESADMWWVALNWQETEYYEELKQDGINQPKKAIPCWSLASLLGILPDYTLQTNTDGTVFVVCDSKKPMISDAYDNPIDACVDIIENLHELKKL